MITNSRKLYILWSLVLLFQFVSGSEPEDSPQIPSKRLPNVILIAIDTLRSDHLGCYGYERGVSPHIDFLAAEGILFEQCYSAASWTLPSFMSIFTGVMPRVHGCNSVSCPGLSSSLTTLTEQYHACGYFCGAVVCNPSLAGKYGFYRGFDIYDDYSVYMDLQLEGFGSGLTEETRLLGERVTGQHTTWHARNLLIRAKDSGQPFFLFILYFDPHVSYIPPDTFKQWDTSYTGPVHGHNLEAIRNHPPRGRDLDHLIALYDGEIAYTDEQVGQFLQTLDELSEPKNTLTILFSDHGEAFAEHGILMHGNSAYREEIMVPLIWRWPGVLPQGLRIASSVSTLDITATLTELLPSAKMNQCQGLSLWPALRGEQLLENRLIFSQKANEDLVFPHHFALTRGPYRFHALSANYVFDTNSRLEFYDRSRDPDEQHNLINSNPAQVLSMKQSLVQFQQACEDLRTAREKGCSTSPVPLTEQERRQLESLGYIGDN